MKNESKFNVFYYFAFKFGNTEPYSGPVFMSSYFRTFKDDRTITKAEDVSSKITFRSPAFHRQQRLILSDFGKYKRKIQAQFLYPKKSCCIISKLAMFWFVLVIGLHF